MKISKSEQPPPPVVVTAPYHERQYKYTQVYAALIEAEPEEWIKVSELSRTEAKSIVLGLDRQHKRGIFGNVKVEHIQRKNGDGFAVWLRKVEAT